MVQLKNGPVRQLDAPSDRSDEDPGAVFGQIILENGHVRYVELPAPPNAAPFKPITARESSEYGEGIFGVSSPSIVRTG
jgi:hypothetical protein